jgi:hypothetical protein
VPIYLMLSEINSLIRALTFYRFTGFNFELTIPPVKPSTSQLVLMNTSLRYRQ